MARNEAAFAQTEYNWQFESSDRAFRGVPRFRRFINSNRTSSMGELPIRCQLKRPYFTLPGYFSPADISKENLTRFALTGLELARPADWRQNMTNHKTRTLILGLFFEARGPPYAFYLISPRPLDLNLETLGTFVQSITRPWFQPGTSTSSSSSHKSWRQRRGEATTRRHLDAQHVSECTVRVSECKP